MNILKNENKILKTKMYQYDGFTPFFASGRKTQIKLNKLNKIKDSKISHLVF